MKCGDVERLRTAYVDGELADGRASALRGHIRGCVPCRELIEDEVRLAGAAEELEILDPPPALWNAIREQIAEEEVADAERGRVWLWWQGLREHALPAAVAAVAVVLVVAWWVRPGQGDVQGPAAQPAAAQELVAQHLAPPELPPVPAPSVNFDVARRAELDRADARYTQVIADLRELAELEREHMTVEESLELTATLAEFDELAHRERVALAATGSLDPSDREPLYGAYREEISVLRSIAVAGVMR